MLSINVILVNVKTGRHSTGSHCQQKWPLNRVCPVMLTFTITFTGNCQVREVGLSIFKKFYKVYFSKFGLKVEHESRFQFYELFAD